MTSIKQKNLKPYLSLGKHPIFEGWGVEELRILGDLCEIIELQVGEYVFMRDQACYAFYLIEEGEVQLQWQTKTGQVKVLHQRAQGGAVGDACVLMGDRYRVDAVVTQPATLIRISKQHFYGQLSQHPHLMVRLVNRLSQDLCSLFGDVLTASSISGTQRVINYLLAKVPLRNHTVVELERSKAQVAASLNLTPEHFSRILHDLAQRGFIEVIGRQVAIEDVDGLLCYSR